MPKTLIPLLLIGCLIVTGCGDTGRLDRLEADIRELKADTRDMLGGAESKAKDSGSVSQRVRELEDRLVNLEAKTGSEEFAYLRAGTQGSAVMQTDHGPFLIRLDGIKFNVGGSGYTLSLEIGNPGGLAVDQFLLKGDYGAGTPVLPKGESYSPDHPLIKGWLDSLTPFEERITSRLEPMSWTAVDVNLSANSRDDLQLMRFTMSPELTEIQGVRAQAGGDDAFALISVGANSAAVLRTEYGAFLVAITGARSKGVGTELQVQIGNPYGFDINQCRLVGDFGGPIPKRRVGEPAAKFQTRLRAWIDGVKPLDAPITNNLGSLRWSTASIVVPGAVGEVKTLRAQLKIENVTLPETNK